MRLIGGRRFKEFYLVLLSLTRELAKGSAMFSRKNTQISVEMLTTSWQLSLYQRRGTCILFSLKVVSVMLG